MSQGMPSFWNSPYFVPEPDKWHLTDDAPEEIREEFEKYMKESEDEKNIIIDYFVNDDDSPATVTSIEPLTELGEHYFKVNGTDGNGEFETTVFIDDALSVQVLPE